MFLLSVQSFLQPVFLLMLPVIMIDCPGNSNSTLMSMVGKLPMYLLVCVLYLSVQMLTDQGLMLFKSVCNNHNIYRSYKRYGVDKFIILNVPHGNIVAMKLLLFDICLSFTLPIRLKLVAG